MVVDIEVTNKLEKKSKRGVTPLVYTCKYTLEVSTFAPKLNFSMGTMIILYYFMYKMTV